MNCNYETCNEETMDGKELCQFHAPIGEKTITDDDFKTHIDQMINKGNLDFQGYVFSIPVEIHNKAYNKSANFQDATFYKQVLISSTTFNAPVSFVDAEFKAGLKMTSVHFHRKTDFTRAKFTGSYLTEAFGPASIYGEQVSFHAGVGFVESVFQHQVYFRHCNFLGEETNFFWSLFQRGLDFRNSSFGGQLIDFTSAQINGLSADFSDCTFNTKMVQFEKTKFSVATVSFQKSRFGKNAQLIFKNSQFQGKLVDFVNLQFLGGLLLFRNCEFLTDKIDFASATLSADLISFEETLIRGSCNFSFTTFEALTINFNRLRCEGKLFNFQLSRFKAKYITFDHAQFACKKFAFVGCTVDEGVIMFHGTSFEGEKVDFSSSRFNEDVIFRYNKISAAFRFQETQFGENANFYFTDPTFLPSANNIFLFVRVRFNPHKTFFQRIHSSDSAVNGLLIDKPRFVFRYSFLKEVIFAENEMSLFSFYRCALFEEAFITNSDWSNVRDRVLGWLPWPYYNRPYLIHEDILQSEFDQGKSPRRKPTQGDPDYQAQYPTTYAEIADLYLRYKSSADRAKDYNLASSFYFNEIEMKRRQLVFETRLTSRLHKRIAKQVFSRAWIYGLYKILAGYGEKPMWSFFWFIIFTTFFSIIHLFNGISVKYQGESLKDINYKLSLTWPPPFEVSLSDVFYSIAFTLSRIIPTNYFPGKPMDLSPLTGTPWDYFFSIFNSIVLVLMVVFVAIGLKRHFRRF